MKEILLKLINWLYNLYYFNRKIKLKKVFISKEFHVEISKKGKNRKRALVFHRTYPFLWSSNDIRFNEHSVAWETREIVNLLLDRSYNVDILSNWFQGNRGFIINDKYDLFFEALDINASLTRYYPYLENKTKKIVHLLSSYPPFEAEAEMIRIRELEKRRGFCTPKRTQMINKEICDLTLALADNCVLIGNEITLGTYPAEFREKIDLITVSASNSIIKNKDEFYPSSKEFLFYSGPGAVHKGLDLVLEVFIKRKDLKLNVVGPTINETDFMRLFQNDLSVSKNIKFYGTLNPKGKAFEEIVKKSFCFIAPSCSEGISTAVLTCMRVGLFPIISKNTGVTLPLNCGLYLENLSIESIDNCVEMVSRMSSDIIIDQIAACQSYVLLNHSREKYSRDMSIFLDKAIGASSFDSH